MPNNRWISLANDFPYAEKLSSGWLDVDRSQDGYWTEYEKALDAYLDSRDGRRPLPARYACLTDSRDRFQALYDQGDTDLAVCLGLLRTQYELENYQASMDLIRLISESKSRRSEADEISIDRPFLSPHPDYDHRAVRDGLNSWLDAALSHARQQCTAKAAPAVSSRSLAVKAHWTLTIADGVRVCVPATVKSMTSYVLLEQEDWFEAELPFLRSLIEPGMGVLDIGANHGVYALSLAKRLQGRGLVIACEPANAPSSLLERSIIENGLQETLSLWRVGLSDHEGEAELVIHANSELSSLSAGTVSGQTETVRLTTLDALMDAPEWLPGRQVDIVKLDASGEESRILQGGRRFFAEQDPLVLCSIRVDAVSDMAQLDTLRDLGMDLYRLVPGLNALAPVAEGEAFDRFQINLFACKPSRAKRLEMAGFLVGAAEAAAPPVRTWPQALASLPFVTALYADGRALDFWQAIDRTGDRYWSAYEQAFNAYLSACDVGQPVSLRQDWLKLSRELLDELNAEGDEHLATVLLRLRVLAAVGARNEAVEANARLVQALETDSRFLETDLPARLDRPFLPPLADYDQRAPQGSLGAWLQAAIFENLEIGRAYSTYFESDKRILQALADNPNRSLAMDRRRALLALVNGKQVQLTSDSPLRGPTSMPMHQNIAWWQRLPEPEPLAKQTSDFSLLKRFSNSNFQKNSNRPLFSIVVPTRNRHDTLIHTLNCLVSLDGDDYEIIVMDNNSSAETRSAVDSIACEKIKYHRSNTTLPMRKNWEKALSHAKGQYVTFIGDDDSLTPDCLQHARKLVSENVDIISWQPHTYWWPNTIIESQRGMFYFSMGKKTLKIESKKTLQAYCDNPLNFGILPQIYNSFVKIDLINRVKSKLSCYFADDPVDIVSGILNLIESDFFIFLQTPLSIRGNSKHSNGTAHWCKSAPGGEAIRNQGLLDEGRAPKSHAMLIESNAFPIILISKHIELAEMVNYKYGNILRVDANKMILAAIQGLINNLYREPDDYEKISQDIIRLAKKYNISHNRLQIPSKAEIKITPTASPSIAWDSDNLSIALNTNLLSIKNIEGVYFWLASMLPSESKNHAGGYAEI